MKNKTIKIVIGALIVMMLLTSSMTLVSARKGRSFKEEPKEPPVPEPEMLTFNLYEGFNLITIPTLEEYTAKTLGNIIEGCVAVIRFNTIDMSWSTFLVGISPDSRDFPIEPGVGYFVVVNQDTTFEIPKNPIDSVSVNIHQGWNYIGWFSDEPVLASELGDSLYECSAISIFDAEIGQYKTFMPGISPSSMDFEIEQGMGIAIYSASPQISIYTGQV